MEQRWDFLSPWWSVLRGRASYTVFLQPKESWDEPKRNLFVRLPTRYDSAALNKGEYNSLGPPYYNDAEFQGHFQRIRDALALLAAVASFDKSGWRFLLETKCGVKFGESGQEMFEQDVEVRFLLGMAEDRKRYSEYLEQDIVRFCGLQQRTDPSPEYLKALGEIAALRGELTRKYRGLDVKIPVQLVFTTSVYKREELKDGCLNPLKSIQAAEKVVREQWGGYEESEDPVVERGKVRCTFVLEPMVADISHTFVTPGMADTIESLVCDNVRFSRLSARVVIMHDGREYRDRRMMLGKFYSRIFDSSRRASTSGLQLMNNPSSSLQIDTLYLNFSDSMMAYDFESMLSAVVVCQTVRKLHFNFWAHPHHPRISGHRWEWLAYGLFSKRARVHSSLESLTLVGIGCMSAEDMRGFTNILESDHPENGVCFGDLPAVVEDRDATLKAGSPFHWKFETNGQPILDVDDIVLESPIPSVRVFSDDGKSEWVNVLIPGFGRCHVERKNLEFTEPRTAPSTSRGLTSLEIRFVSVHRRIISDPDEPASITSGLPQFLKMVGASLKSLALAGPRMAVDVDEILQSCPVLEELSLCGASVDVRFNFSEYRAKHNAVPSLNCDWENCLEVARYLSDVANPLVKCVRRVRVHLFNRRDDLNGARRIADTFRALLRMLFLNCHLEYLDVRVPSLDVPYIYSFKECHLTPISRPLKLQTPNKLAFLSVLLAKCPSALTSKAKRHTASRPHSVVCELDNNVISKVFAFAAPPALREVYLQKE